MDRETAVKLWHKTTGGAPVTGRGVELFATAVEREERKRAVLTPEQLDAVYSAWHGAGIDIAGGNWARFVGMLPKA